MAYFDYGAVMAGVDSLKLIPAGLYPCEIDFVSYKNRGRVRRLIVEMNVLNGPCAGSRLRDNIFFAHPRSKKCVQHGFFRFKTLVRAIDKKRIRDTNELMKQRVMVHLIIVIDRAGDDCNLVYRYSKLEYDNPNQEFAVPIDEVHYSPEIRLDHEHKKKVDFEEEMKREVPVE